jgi:three-Cys-motif partner protein
MTPKLDKDWIIEQFNLLTAKADQITSAGGEPETEFRELTVLKLSVLSVAVDLYTKIALPRYDNCHYIDALAGPGVTRLKEMDEHVIGSPILTPTVAHRDTDEFSQYHFIEQDSDRADALDDRLDYVASARSLDYPREIAETHQGNCNDVVPELVDEIKRDEDGNWDAEGVSLLSFIDNSAFDAKWSTVSNLAKVHGDMVITFPPTRISRDKGRIQVLGEDYREQRITDFYGTEAWKNCDTEKEYVNLYCDRIENVARFQRLTETVRIETGAKGGRYYYWVIYSTRKTDNDSPYMDAIKHVKNRTERLTGGDIKNVIEMFRGDQAGLEQF